MTGYVPATENSAVVRRNGQVGVIRYRNGKTVEVLSTDAEGRLILADALLQAVQETDVLLIWPRSPAPV